MPKRNAMKITTTILILVLSLTAGTAQNRVALAVEEVRNQRVTFTELQPLSKSDAALSADAGKVVRNATFAKLNEAVLTSVMQHQYPALRLRLPYGNEVITVDLVKVDIYNRDFHIDSDKARNIPYQKGVHYRGMISGNPKSLASFNFFNGELNGIVSDLTYNNLVVGKLAAGNDKDYIVYSDAEMLVPNNFNCMVKDKVVSVPQRDQYLQRSALSERCVTTYFEIDHDLFLANGSSTTLTSNWMTSVFNNVQTLFANDGITISLKSLYIWTEDDPYEGDSSFEYLFQFNDVRPVFDGDVGQLVGLDPGGLGGVAVTINGLCSQNNFSYSDVDFNVATVPTFSWTVQVVSHELGHLLGSPHTHACVWNGNNTSIDGCGTQAGYEEGNCGIGPIPSPQEKGTIMSYCHLIGGVGISFVNGFGPQPAEAILIAVETSTCLSTDCINTCINTIAEITASDVTTTSATLTWNDLTENPGSYEVSVSPLDEGSSGFLPVSGSSIDVSGLEPNTFYLAEIRPTCENAEPVTRRQLFATAADWCSGVTITDTGGTSGNYGDMEEYTRVLIPNLPQKAIRLDFVQVDLEFDYDFLYIFDGASTDSPELTGGLTGTFNPGSFTSTSADGALTLKFASDQYVTEGGYVAQISCEENLSVGDAGSIIDFRYYPNPTRDVINLLSNTQMSDVTVYNVQGQLLYQNAPGSLDAKVDMTSFASGTYFFKVKVGDKEINFRMIRD